PYPARFRVPLNMIATVEVGCHRSPPSRADLQPLQNECHAIYPNAAYKSRTAAVQNKAMAWQTRPITEGPSARPIAERLKSLRAWEESRSEKGSQDPARGLVAGPAEQQRAVDSRIFRSDSDRAGLAK